MQAPPAKPVRTRPAPRDSELGHWLPLAASRAADRLRERLAPEGVTVSESILLRQIYRSTPASPTMLVPEVGMTKGAVSKILAQLRRKGLVARGIDEEDHRHHALALTRKGSALLGEIEGAFAAHEAACFGHLTRRERADLLTTLQALAGY